MVTEVITDRYGVGSDEDNPSSLRNATLEGVRWITYGRVAYEIVAVSSLAVLAHLISPAEYGRVAIALILQGLAISLTNEGFGNPLVQRKIVRDAHFESAAFMSVAFAFGVGALVFLLSPLVITPLYGVATTHLFQLASILFPVYGFVIVPEAILQRRMDLRRITIVETVGSLVGALLSIGLAVAGFGGTAIILGTIASGALTALMLLVSVGMPRLRLHRLEAREVTSYGGPASVAGLVYFGVRNVDNVLVGARLGTTQLGIYYRAFALGVGNQLKIGVVLLRVAFPSLSRAESPEQMKEMRDRMTQLNATVTVPLLILLAILAPRLVPFVLGGRWTPAVVPTQILAFAGAATSLASCALPFLFASGHPKWVLRLNLATFVVYAGGILVALPYGLGAVCVSVVVTNVLTMIASYGLMNRLAGVPLRRIILDASPSVVATAAMAAVTIPLMSVLSRNDVPTVVILLLVGGAGAAAYAVALRAAFRSAYDDVLLVLRGLVSPKRRRFAKAAWPEQTPPRMVTRRWVALALGLPCIGFGVAYAAGKATVASSPRTVRATAQTPRQQTSEVSLLAVAPVKPPINLKASPPARANAAPVLPAVAAPIAPGFAQPEAGGSTVTPNSGPSTGSAGSGTRQPVSPIPSTAGGGSATSHSKAPTPQSTGGGTSGSRRSRGGGGGTTTTGSSSSGTGTSSGGG